jgi:hypothetical protein
MDLKIALMVLTYVRTDMLGLDMKAKGEGRGVLFFAIGHFAVEFLVQFLFLASLNNPFDLLHFGLL